jgi:hypothetical protein
MACVTHVLSGSTQYRRGIQHRNIDDLRDEANREYGSFDLDKDAILDLNDYRVQFDDEILQALGGLDAPPIGLPRLPTGTPEMERNPWGTLGHPRTS